MNKQIITTETMQAEHREWLKAHAQWRQDIERWQKENESAVAQLTKMQKVVRESGECLEEHSRSLLRFEDAVAAHEREIAGQNAGRIDKLQDVAANRHQEQEGVFSQQQDAHERIKKHHEAVMAQLQALEATAAAAM